LRYWRIVEPIEAVDSSLRRYVRHVVERGALGFKGYGLIFPQSRVVVTIVSALECRILRGSVFAVQWNW